MNKYFYLFVLIYNFSIIILNLISIIKSFSNLNVIVIFLFNLFYSVYGFILMLIDYTNSLEQNNRIQRIHICIRSCYLLTAIVYNVMQIILMGFFYGDRCHFGEQECLYLQFNFYFYFIYLGFSVLMTLIMVSNINKIKLKKIHSTAEECSICMEEMQVLGVETLCQHHFHEDCIKKWGKVNNNCPLCFCSKNITQCFNFL